MGKKKETTCVRYCCWPNRRKDLAVCRLLVTLMNSFGGVGSRESGRSVCENRYKSFEELCCKRSKEMK